MKYCDEEGKVIFPTFDEAFNMPKGEKLHYNQGALLETIKQYEETIKSLEETIEFYRARPPISSTIIFWAFRYCLEHSTYAVMECVDYLVLYWDRIPEATRDKIVEEIFEACEKKDCGIEMDKSQWHRVLERAGVNVVFPEHPNYTKCHHYCKKEMSCEGYTSCPCDSCPCFNLNKKKEEPCTTNQSGSKL